MAKYKTCVSLTGRGYKSDRQIILDRIQKRDQAIVNRDCVKIVWIDSRLYDADILSFFNVQMVTHNRKKRVYFQAKRPIKIFSSQSFTNQKKRFRVSLEIGFTSID